MTMQHLRRTVKPRVATNFPSLSRGLDINPNLHMFAQDVHLAVMPVGGRSEKHKNYSVIFEGGSEEREKAKQLLGTIARYDEIDEKEIVSDAIQEIALHLAWEGCAVFEIIHEESGEIYLQAFTSKRLFRFPGCFVQIIPFKDQELWKRRMTIVPAKAIWYLEMPAVLGGRSGYRRMLARLKRFEHLGPSFWRKDLDLRNPPNYFDFQGYVRKAEIYYGWVTKAWGWNRRDWSQERSTEFFIFYKAITFHWAQAILREHIIDELNRLMIRLNIVCKLKVTGLPTSEEIIDIRRSLQEGTVSFATAFDKVSM